MYCFPGAGTILLANRGVQTNSPDGNNPQQVALTAVGKDPREAGLSAGVGGGSKPRL